jgi:hypothetical protein
MNKQKIYLIVRSYICRVATRKNEETVSFLEGMSESFWGLGMSEQAEIVDDLIEMGVGRNKAVGLS